MSAYVGIVNPLSHPFPESGTPFPSLFFQTHTTLPCLRGGSASICVVIIDHFCIYMYMFCSIYLFMIFLFYFLYYYFYLMFICFYSFLFSLLVFFPFSFRRSGLRMGSLSRPDPRNHKKKKIYIYIYTYMNILDR